MRHPEPLNLPLDGLFRRLELAGFELSPADRLRAWKVLGGPGKEYLDQPDQLKLLLGPVLARSAAEQQKFAELFDQYYAEISTPLDLPDRNRIALPPWVVIGFSLLLATLVGISMWQLTRPVSAVAVRAGIAGPDSGPVGDTLIFRHEGHLPEDTSQLSWRWGYVDMQSGEVEYEGEQAGVFRVIIPPLQGGYNKEIRLAIEGPGSDRPIRTRIPFVVTCATPPATTGILAPEQANPKEAIEFQLTAEEQVLLTDENTNTLTGPAADWEIRWEFGDGREATGHQVEHTYEEEGQYQVRVTVTDPNGGGFCQKVHSHDIKVGQEDPILPTYPLRKDQLSLIAIWGWGFWVAVGLLALAVIYFWARWLWWRPEPELPEKKQQVVARFQVNDKAPYYIPLPDQNNLIAPHAATGRLADAMRLRQQGLREVIDVPQTLQKTIDQGGFPDLHFRYLSQPSEYLFLIDEQSQFSHLGRLFRYLAELLRGQDVHLEMFYYRRQLNRFWNAQNPSGLSLEMIYRQHPGHRLVVMGDLHELIDPYAKGQPRLRPTDSALFRSWRQAFVMTPVPPVSWSYREKLLSRQFSVFPADVDGIAAAALALENESDPLSDGMLFDQWKDKQLALRRDADTEHRRWKRWRGIEEYLSEYDPILREWFLALAIFPTPNWEMTLAIGRALKAPITYDNLLILARIPALQQERFDERLRQEMLAQLDRPTERIAREAMRRELEGLKVVTANSHAGHHLETALAVQEFALDPYAPDNRDAIRFLLDQGMLNKAQEKELDRVAAHYQQPVQKTAKRKVAMKRKESPVKAVREWLAEDAPPEEETPKPPFFTADLWRAIAATVLYLALLFFVIDLSGSPRLYQWVFGNEPTEIDFTDEGELRHYLFVKEKVLLDSAIIYNNQGVDRWQADSIAEANTSFIKALAAAQPFLPGKADQFNGEAVPYALANANLAAVYYNMAVNNFNRYLEDREPARLDNIALTLNDAYRSDSLAFWVQHARGLVHFYRDEYPDSVQYYFDELDGVGFFDTISYSPNLATLMGRERSHILSISPSHIGDQVVEVLVNYVTTNIPNSAYELIVFPASGAGLLPDTVRTSIPLEAGSTTIRLEPPARRGGQSREVVVQLLGLDGEMIDEVRQDFRHEWAIRAVTPPPEQQPTTNRIPFSFHGTIVDDLSGNAIVGARIDLIDLDAPPTRQRAQFQATSTGGGSFVIDGVFEERALSASYVLEVIADGYNLYQREWRVAAITRRDAANPAEIRLEPTKQNIDTTQGPPPGEGGVDCELYRENGMNALNTSQYELALTNFEAYLACTPDSRIAQQLIIRARDRWLDALNEQAKGGFNAPEGRYSVYLDQRFERLAQAARYQQDLQGYGFEKARIVTLSPSNDGPYTVELERFNYREEADAFMKSRLEAFFVDAYVLDRQASGN